MRRRRDMITSMYTRLCDICHVKLQGRNINRDHCHTTGNNRGILCRSCNWGLGHFKDDTSLLIRAMAYLRYHRGEINNEKLYELYNTFYPKTGMATILSPLLQKILLVQSKLPEEELKDLERYLRKAMRKLEVLAK